MWKWWATYEYNLYIVIKNLLHISKLAKLHVIIPLSLTSLHGLVLQGRSNIQRKKRVGQKWNFGSAIWRQSWNVKQILFFSRYSSSANTTSRLPSLLSNTICWKKRKSCLTGTLTTFFLEFWMSLLPLPHCKSSFRLTLQINTGFLGISATRRNKHNIEFQRTFSVLNISSRYWVACSYTKGSMMAEDRRTF